jgi:hypothetical protein
MNVFADVGWGAKEAGSVGGETLLELPPHRMAMCHLMQVFVPTGAQQVGVPAGSPFLFQSLAHHNSLGLFLFFLSWVRTCARALPKRRGGHGSVCSCCALCSLLSLVLSVIFCSRSSVHYA